MLIVCCLQRADILQVILNVLLSFMVLFYHSQEDGYSHVALLC